MAGLFRRGRSSRNSSKRIRFSTFRRSLAKKRKSSSASSSEEKIASLSSKKAGNRTTTTSTTTQEQGLSLDPQRKKSHHRFRRNDNLSHVEEEEGAQKEEELEQEQEQEQVEQQEKEEPFFHGHNFPHQELNLHQQLLYSRLHSQQPEAAAQHHREKRGCNPSSSSSSPLEEHARLGEKMGDPFQQFHQQQQQHQQQTSSRLGLTRGAGGGSGGEIVQVQGGHIVRSTGRKDRHSKVCTAKGPRDRRVRLSAQTAIQFYDVQDRLGYDRPSKAVDWLIKKAKAAIDELAELPAWKPTATIGSSTPNPTFEHSKQHQTSPQETHQNLSIHHCDMLDTLPGGSNADPSGSGSSFLPASMDSDSIADTIKSFFPMGASNEQNSSAMPQLQSFPPPDLLSRTSSHSQDLRLSLLSFQDPLLLHHHGQHSQHHPNPTNHNEQSPTLFSGASSVQLGFDGSGWSEHHHHHQQQNTELGRFQISMNGGAAQGGGGYVYNPGPGSSSLLPAFFGQSHQLFSTTQRGPLQSSNAPTVRGWMIDPSSDMAMNSSNHSQQLQHHHQPLILNYHQPTAGVNFASRGGVGGGFSGFRIPSRIQGDEEEHDGISDKPSSASSDSRH